MKIHPLVFLNSKLTQRPGQSLVEFALTLPILLLIVLGAVDLGRVFNDYVAITNASREGARYGANDPTNDEGIIDRVRTEAEGSGVIIDLIAHPNAIQVDCYRISDNYHYSSCGDASKGDKIQVTVTVDFDLVSLFLLRISSFPISTSTTMALINGK